MSDRNEGATLPDDQKAQIIAIVNAPRQEREDIQTMLGSRLRAIRDVIDPESKVAREQASQDFARRYRESVGPVVAKTIAIFALACGCFAGCQYDGRIYPNNYVFPGAATQPAAERN